MAGPSLVAVMEIGSFVRAAEALGRGNMKDALPDCIGDIGRFLHRSFQAGALAQALAIRLQLPTVGGSAYIRTLATWRSATLDMAKNGWLCAIVIGVRSATGGSGAIE